MQSIGNFTWCRLKDNPTISASKGLLHWAVIYRMGRTRVWSVCRWYYVYNYIPCIGKCHYDYIFDINRFVRLCAGPDKVGMEKMKGWPHHKSDKYCIFPPRIICPLTPSVGIGDGRGGVWKDLFARPRFYLSWALTDLTR